MIKTCYCTSLVISLPFTLDTDANDVGIGAVLSQTDEKGAERVVAYGSKSLSRVEQHYCVTRKEILAVVHFVRHFYWYWTVHTTD